MARIEANWTPHSPPSDRSGTVLSPRPLGSDNVLPWPLGVALRIYRAPSRIDRPELLDQPRIDPSELRGNLRDLGRVNRWLGGHRLTLASIERLTERERGSRPLALLDVGTGGGDLLTAIQAWARSQGIDVRIFGCDLNPDIAREAKTTTGGCAPVIVADAFKLPFADRVFDVATCSLVTHHFSPDTATRLLFELRRVSRRGVVVNDLIRSWPGSLGALLLARLFTRNRLTRHDAPLSARRAYTEQEMREIIRSARLHPIQAFTVLGYRMSFACEPLA